MTNQNCIITPAARQRLETQGYIGYTDTELGSFKFGIRFAYYLCGFIAVLGLLLTSPTILFSAMVIALMGAILPRHPFDYLYNHVIRYWINKPQIPLRTKQGHFACGMAVVWLAVTTWLFYAGLNTWGYVLGYMLVGTAILVVTMDVCIPSMIYNFLFSRKSG
ncbi:MAG: hypothetical protein BroJett018_21360 [Chloroflexota bacterium]|nr:DUF4395 family protein [Chloroflexota bacterium]GIK64342.1 MAG: hypothetical protein BroJett018_21360 [Chloroflexota bacterium]